MQACNFVSVLLHFYRTYRRRLTATLRAQRGMFIYYRYAAVTCKIKCCQNLYGYVFHFPCSRVCRRHTRFLAAKSRTQKCAYSKIGSRCMHNKNVAETCVKLFQFYTCNHGLICYACTTSFAILYHNDVYCLLLGPTLSAPCLIVTL